MSQWTKKLPTEEGPYWAYEKSDPVDADVMLIEISRWGDHLIVWYDGDQAWSLDDFSHFMKIEKPNPPEVSQ